MDTQDNQQNKEAPQESAQAGVLCRYEADMNLEGQFTDCALEVTETHLRSTCEGETQVVLPREDVEFVLCTEYVGNGQVEAKLRDGRQVPVLRYSKTHSERFEEAEEEINRLLGRELSEDEREEQRGTDAPSEDKLSYRCPNCGYPLPHQGDVCPKCVSVRSTMFRLLKYMRPYWKEATVGVLLAMALTGLALIPAVILRHLIDGPLREPKVLPEEKLAAADEDRFANEGAAELARKHGVNSDVLEGTGARGLITRSDVQRYLNQSDLFASSRAHETAWGGLAPPQAIVGSGPDEKITITDVNSYVEETADLPADRTVRRWAFQMGVDLRELEGTGEDGRILVRDVIEASKPGRYRMVLFLVAGLLCVFIVRSLIAMVRTRLMGSLGAKLIHDIRSELYRALQRLSLSFYDHQHTGRIMSRVTSDTKTLRAFIVGGFPNMLIYVMTILGIGALMIYRQWDLALLTLLATPLMVLGTIWFARRMRVRYRRLRRKNASVYKAVSETISGVRVVRAFGQEDREISSFVDKSSQYREALVDAIKLKSIFSPAMVFLTALGMVVIYSYGGCLVIRGDMELGVLVMFNTLMVQFYAPVRALTQLTDVFQSTAVSAERVFGVLDTPSEVSDAVDAAPLSKVEGRIVFDHVDFSYEKGERVLRDIDLEVKPGEIIGLVGQTGSGKSTVVKLVARFYDPTKGTVLLDGHDLRRIRVKDLRANIGMVLQETFLFTGTLRENISYGRPDASNQEIIEAARAANAHDFIMDMPDAYDTYLGERGVGLSGGEKQRIAIARAILKDPAILILDEATSAVDTATEAMIQEALDRLMEGRTTFAIAHRLSTLKNADRLVVLEDGEITEMGTHEELLSRKDGIYRNLVEIQDLVSGSSALKQKQGDKVA